ncbi:MAG: porin family protein [Dysgonamonadaceae bacterium]
MKRFLLIIPGVLCCFMLFAQKTDFKSEFYLGAGGGIAFSSVDFEPKVSQKTHNGFLGGISAKYISEKHLGLILEMNFIRRGWTEEYKNDPEYSYTRSLNYLEMPFMTHIYFGNNSRFIFNIGPQISYLLNESSSMSDALADYVEQQRSIEENSFAIPEERYEDASHKFDYGIIAGIGFALKTGIGDFDLEGRYYFGLGDILNNRREDYYSRSAHRIVEAKLTYYLKLL